MISTYLQAPNPNIGKLVTVLKKDHLSARKALTVSKLI